MQHKTTATGIAKRKLVFFFAIGLFTTSIANSQASTPTPEIGQEIKERKAATPKFGVKVGYNVAKLKGSSPNYSPDSKNGFMVAAFFAPASKSGIGYRSELVFSRQGFGFDESGKQTNVVSDYIYMPQFTTIGITKFVQLQVGGQIGYLLKSSKKAAASTSEDITSWANKIDYGAAFGAEIYPIQNLVIGGRYNLSMGNAYKQLSTSSTSPIPNPLPFNPEDVKSKNAVLNFYIGFRL